MNGDGSGRQQLTDGKDGVNWDPQVSNDGKSIIYVSSRTGANELWQINLDGSGLKQITKSIDETPYNGKGLSDGESLDRSFSF